MKIDNNLQNNQGVKSKNILVYILLGIIAVLLIFILCNSLSKDSEKVADNIYSILEKNNYKIFYSFNFSNNYYDLDKNIYDSSYKESEFVREVLDEETKAIISIVNMDTVNNGYGKQEHFMYIPRRGKYVYSSYVDNTEYEYYWSADSSVSYIYSNYCYYYINDADNSLNNCTEENAELAKEFYSNDYLSILNKLNITEEDLVNLFDDITSNYVEPHKKYLIENDKGITYKEFLTNIKNSEYDIKKLSSGIAMTESRIFSGIPSQFNMYISFTGNNVESFFLELWEENYLIYDNTKEQYFVMPKDSNCLYDVYHKFYSSECSENDKTTLISYTEQSDIEYYYSWFLSNFRTSFEEFIVFVEQYYINN